jgi:hypothetical protein
MRISTLIVLFFVFMNAGAFMLQSTGVAAHMGVNAETGDPSEIQQAQDAAENINTGNNVGGTLFAMYNSLVGVVESIFAAMFPGAQMLSNLGVPDWFTAYLFSGATIITGVDVIGFLRGSNL